MTQEGLAKVYSHWSSLSVAECIISSLRARGLVPAAREYEHQTVLYLQDRKIQHSYDPAVP